jgi:hypothetical protein
MAGPETEVLKLERELLVGGWRPGRYVEIEVFEPKPRAPPRTPSPHRAWHQHRSVSSRCSANIAAASRHR